MELGLVGYPLSHSFSPAYFARKFARLGLKHARYDLFALARIEELPELLQVRNQLAGFNVTIPYKQEIIPFLDELSGAAKRIGAVNVVDCREGCLLGYNTDVIGFRQALEEQYSEFLTSKSEIKALVLGTGGASLAVCDAFWQMGIAYKRVSRSSGGAAGVLTYKELTVEVLSEYDILVNTTPLGMVPRDDEAPDLPYQAIGEGHLLYDLVYNPAETLFLKRGRYAGAQTLNGLRMLELQADAAWAIWAKGRL